MSARGWIAARRELLDATTEGPWFQGRSGRRYESDRDVYSRREPDEEDSHDIATYVWSAEDAALIADARTSLPLALEALGAVLKEVWRIESGHHFHGTTCTCGYASHRARDRTEHLTRPLTDAIEAALRAES